VSFADRRPRQNRAAVGELTAAQLLRLPVRLHGVELGRPVDLILDRGRRRVLGFDVRCGDGERRFVPFSVATPTATELVIRTPLVILERAELAFYTERGSTFAALRRSGVARGGRTVGELDDLVVAPDGRVTCVVVSTARGRETLDPAGLELGASRTVRAAS